MGNFSGSDPSRISNRRSCPPARNLLLWILLPVFMLSLCARPVGADPLMTIPKDTLLGGVTGLILGGTLTLVVDEEDRSEVVRWGVVLGTFGGFGFGIWRATRGEDEDLFGAIASPEITPEGLASRAPAALLAWAGQRTARAADDPAVREREHRDSTGDFHVRIPLLRFDW